MDGGVERIDLFSGLATSRDSNGRGVADPHTHHGVGMASLDDGLGFKF